jgi:hypothetical protein
MFIMNSVIDSALDDIERGNADNAELPEIVLTASSPTPFPSKT